MSFLSKLLGNFSTGKRGSGATSSDFPSQQARETYNAALAIFESSHPGRPVENFVARDAPELDRLPPAIGSATALRRFGIAGTAVSDLSPLRSLRNVETIDISGSRVTSLAPLEGFHKLKTLKLANTKVTSLAPLAGLESLKEVNLAGTDVRSLEPLAQLPRLKILNIERTTGISPDELSRLPRLEDVDISETPFESLEAIAGFVNLRWLAFRNTRISSLEPIARLVKLQILSLGDSAVDSLEHLRNLRELEFLDISNTKVSGLGPLAELKTLTSVHMNNTPVNSIDALAGLTNLTRLSIAGTPVTNLRPLLELPLGGDDDYDGVEFSDCAACRNDPELARIAAITHSGKERFARLCAYLAGTETTNVVEAGQHERSNVAMYLFDYDKMESSYGAQARRAIVEALPSHAGRGQLAEGDLEVAAGGVSKVPAFLQSLRNGRFGRFGRWAIEPASTDSPLYALDSAAALNAHAVLVYFQESMYPPSIHEQLRQQMPGIYLGCAVRKLSARSRREFEDVAASLHLVSTGGIMGVP